MIQLVNMMGFFHTGSIRLKTVHDTCQIRIHCTKNSHSKAEIATPKQCLILFAAHAPYIFTMLCYPSRASTHHLHMVRKRAKIVGISHLRCGELNGYIRTLEGFAVEILLIVDIYDRHYFVSSSNGNLLYHSTHLTVSNKSYFHSFPRFFGTKVMYFHKKDVYLFPNLC